MSTATTPAIGRIVHYVARGSADGKYPPTCRAAVVTAVDGARQPATAVLSPEGLFFSLPLPYAAAQPLTGGTSHWPTLSQDGSPCA